MKIHNKFVLNFSMIAILASTICGLAIADEWSVPGFKMGNLTPVTPDEAQVYFQQKQAEIDASMPLEMEQMSMAMPSVVSSGDAEIDELARGLKYDLDLIFKYVYENIEYEPTYGDVKGAYMTLMDKSGNSFDQSSLLISLLRQSGYTANYVWGKIELTLEDAANWLGTPFGTALGTPDEESVVENVLSQGGIPKTKFIDNNSKVEVDHMWVKVIFDDGSYYMLDPSVKKKTHITGIDLATAMGQYDRSEFLNRTRPGSVFTSTKQNFVFEETSDYVKCLDADNLADDLSGFSTTLIDYIKTNYPNAGLSEIIGGHEIDEIALSNIPHQSTLDNEKSISGVYTDIDESLKTKITIQVAGGLSGTFDSSEIYGRRLTIFYNENPDTTVYPVLYLEGQVVAQDLSTNAVNKGTSQTLDFIVDHPFAGGGGTQADDTISRTIGAGGQYAIVNGWGNTGAEIVSKHRKALNEYRHAGSELDSEELLGESLMITALSWLAENSRCEQLGGQINGNIEVRHHLLGVFGQQVGPYIDLSSYGGSTDLSNNVQSKLANFFGGTGRGSAFEYGVIEQLQSYSAISTVKLIDLAISNGDKIFKVDNSNYSSVADNDLTDYPDGPGTIRQYIRDKFDDLVFDGDEGVMFIPETAELGEGDPEDGFWNGTVFIGYYDYTNTGEGVSLGYYIGGDYNGAWASNDDAKVDTYDMYAYAPVDPTDGSWYGNDTSSDPIDLVTGKFLYNATDLTVGSGSFPDGLSFSRSYNSGSALNDGPMGLGWDHNYNIKTTESSDGFQAMGADSPIDAAANIVQLFIANDLLTADHTDVVNVMIATMSQEWIMDQMIDNVITVNQPGSSMQFVKLPDGSFNPPPGKAAKLEKEPDDSYKFTTKTGIVLDFGTDGLLSTWQDIIGNEVTFNYETLDLQGYTDEEVRGLIKVDEYENKIGEESVVVGSHQELLNPAPATSFYENFENVSTVGRWHGTYDTFWGVWEYEVQTHSSNIESRSDYPEYGEAILLQKGVNPLDNDYKFYNPYQFSYNFTVSMWAKNIQNGMSGSAFSVGEKFLTNSLDNRASTARSYEAYISSNSFRFTIKQDLGHDVYYICTKLNSESVYASISDNDWHLYTATVDLRTYTYDTGIITLFVDGIEVDTEEFNNDYSIHYRWWTDTCWGDGNGMYVGAPRSGFAGGLDEVMLFNVALNSDQAESLHPNTRQYQTVEDYEVVDIMETRTVFKRLTSVSDDYGHALNFAYANGDGVVTSVTDETGRVVSYGYDSAGNLETFTDAIKPVGNVTTYQYDPSNDGQITKIFDPRLNPGGTTVKPFVTNVYNPLAQVIQQTNPHGFTYDYYFATGHRAEEVGPARATGAIAHWQMSEIENGTIVTDRLGVSDGTVVGAPSCVFGKIGNALLFNGIDDYVSTPLSPNGMQNITLSAWVRPTSDSGQGRIVSPLSWGTDYFHIRRLDTAYHVVAKRNPMALEASISTGEIHPADGNWDHIVGVQDIENKTISLYVNGVEINTISTPDSSDTISGAGNWAIGQGGSSNCFQGSIDDVMIFDRALTADEVNAMYDSSATSLVYEFDGSGNTTKIIDRAGNATTTEYDGHQRKTSITSPQGSKSVVKYDANHNAIETYTIPLVGSAEWIAEDWANSDTWTTQWDQFITTSVYDLEGGYNHLLSTTDRLGNTATYDYYPSGNASEGLLQQVTVPGTPSELSITYTYYDAPGYPEDGLLATVTNPELVVTHYDYVFSATTNKIEKSIVTVDYCDEIATGCTHIPAHLNAQTITDYDTFDDGDTATPQDNLGNVVSVTDVKGNKTRITSYDEMRRPLEVIAPAASGIVTKTEYYADGKVEKVQKFDGATELLKTEYTYTNSGKVETVRGSNYTATNGRETKYQYDSLNRLFKLTDAMGNFTQTLYYPDGKVFKTIDAKGNVPATYTYTTSGSVDTITDAETNETSYEYDGYGRPKKTIYADSTEEQIEYDEYGRVLKTTNRSDQTIEITYDPTLGRVQTKTVKDEYGSATNIIGYGYDAFGRQSDVTDAGGTIDYDYDYLGRLEAVTYPATPVDRTVSYTYDISGNRETLTYPDNSFIEYKYDNLNRLTDILDSGDLASPIVTYGYDALSRRTTADYENGQQTTYSYGNAADTTAGRLIGLTTAGITYNYDTDPIDHDDNYDAVGNLLQFTANDLQHTYSYDDIYQLTNVTYPAGFFADNTTFNYDAVGNRDTINDGSETNYITNNLNQYGQVGPTSSETPFRYDTRGNLIDDTGDAVDDYTYDAENHMTSASVDGTSATYTYDPFGRRASKNVDGSITTYVYDGDQVICEYNTSGGGLTRKFVYGTGIDEPVRMTAVLSADLTNDGYVDLSDLIVLGQSWMLDDSDSGFCRLGDFNDDKVINNSDIDTLADFFATTGDTGFVRQYYYHFDQLGSVIALSDESGNIIETYKYDVFGRPQITDSTDAVVEVSTIGNPYMFTSRRYDPETKLYYYRARMYNPDIARFMQTDPSGYGDGLNWYVYVGNNPIGFVDQYGLEASWWNVLTTGFSNGSFKGQGKELAMAGVEGGLRGAAAGADGFNPTPFKLFEKYYTDENGNMLDEYRTSRFLGNVSYQAASLACGTKLFTSAINPGPLGTKAMSTGAKLFGGHLMRGKIIGESIAVSSSGVKIAAGIVGAAWQTADTMSAWEMGTDVNYMLSHISPESNNSDAGQSVNFGNSSNYNSSNSRNFK